MICERCGTFYCDDWAAERILGGSVRRFCSRQCKAKTTPSYKASKRRAREHERCSRQGKIRYEDAVTAMAVAEWSARQPGGGRTRPYECGCGGWHLTGKGVATNA